MDTLRNVTDNGLRAFHASACDANDRDSAHRACVEMRRRGMPLPAWPKVHEMPDDVAAITPPGVVLLAVLRHAAATGVAWESRVVLRAVALAYPNPDAVRRQIGSDAAHARASGLIVEGRDGRWTLGATERAAAILATLPDDGTVSQCARAAWELASR